MNKTLRATIVLSTLSLINGVVILVVGLASLTLIMLSTF